ncbi:MAG: hypothetical protein IKO36_06150 [Bacteroidaceae bacterium]|nr:hypothetical protein [Bacteroidaceae bacterium]
MTTLNFSLGNRIGIVLAEIAQQKFFDTFDKNEASQVFIESIGCDERFAEKLLIGQYALVVSDEDKTQLVCVERKDLTEEQKKEYPVLDATTFVVRIVNELGGNFEEFNANGFIVDMKDVRDALWKNIKFTITSDLSKLILKGTDADVFAEVSLTAQNITKILIEDEENAQELKDIVQESYLVRSKGYLNPNKFISYILNTIYLKEKGQKILNCIQYFMSNKEFFNITDEHEYNFFKIKACVNFCTELYNFIANDFKWNESLFNK